MDHMNRDILYAVGVGFIIYGGLDSGLIFNINGQGPIHQNDTI